MLIHLFFIYLQTSVLYSIILILEVGDTPLYFWEDHTKLLKMATLYAIDPYS